MATLTVSTSSTAHATDSIKVTTTSIRVSDSSAVTNAIDIIVGNSRGIRTSDSSGVTDAISVTFERTLPKNFLFKVYDPTGVTLQATWQNEVSSDFSYEQAINSAGNDVTVVLARDPLSFGEGADVAFNNQVKVIVIDKEAPNGINIFTGYIANYQPDYDNNNVTVTLMGYGMQLDQYMIENAIASAPYLDIGNGLFFTSTPGTSQTFGQTTWAAFSFIPDPAQPYTGAVEVWGATDASAQVALYTDNNGQPGTAVGTFTSTVSAGLTYGVVDAGGGVSKLSADPLDVANSKAQSNSVTLNKFTWASPPILSPDGAKKYWFVFKSPSAGSTSSDTLNSVYTYGDNLRYLAMTSTNSGTSWTTANGGQGTTVMRVYGGTPQTTVTYNSYDPSDILRDIMTRYAAAGGTLGYDGTTIDTTNTTVSYTFNTNTVWDGLQKCLELAPYDWYFYIDQAANMVHFHRRNQAYDHQLVLAKNIGTLNVEKKTDGIINTIYFTGKAPFFAKFVDSGSKTTYGQKLLRYTDTRVTNFYTARTMSRAILNAHRGPELVINGSVIDSNGGAGGYDIETINVGEVVTFRNFGGTDQQLYDVAQWDVAYWDSVIADIGTYYMQITKIKYEPDQVTISASSLPPDVTKRVEDIARNLTLTQSQNNPTVPMLDS